MSRRFSLVALAVLLYLVIPQVSMASSLYQSAGPNLLDNPTVLFAMVFGAFFAAVIIIGLVIALVAAFISRFFGANVPAADKLAAFNTQQDNLVKAGREVVRKPIVITPTLEPFVISIGGFLAVFILTSIIVKPPPDKNASAAVPAAPAASALPTTGDFTKIVASLPAGNPDNGSKLYTAQGCIGCHSLEKDKRLVGPSFYGVWGRAATRKPNYGPKEYIYESIVLPNAFVVDTYQAGLMPQTFAKQLKPQDMADILAWMERDHNEK